jgi:uncharacterized membrane protein
MVASILVLFCLGFVAGLFALNRIFTRLGELEEKARRLEQSLAAIRESAGISKVLATAPSAPPPVVPATPQVPKAVASVTPVPLGPPQAARPVPPTPETTTPIPAPPKSRTKEEWESLIGGKFLNRIGALALIIGVGFFLKYAFDNDWITEPMRVLIGAFVGAGLLVAARRNARKGFEIFAQGLTGAGISILYLSVYASFNFYSLVSQPVAFVLMALVTIVAFSQALMYNALAVSLLGWLGGFLTPFMLSTGESQMVGLFSYIALLDVGILLVVLRKKEWTVLEPLSLAATYIVFGLWRSESYTPADIVPASLFLSLFWAMFLTTDLIPLFRKSATYMEPRRLMAVVHVAVFFGLLFGMVYSESNDAMSAATAGLGVLYLILGLRLRSLWRDIGAPSMQHILSGTVLFVIATSMYFDGFTIVDLWSLQACILVLLGLRAGMKYLWVAGMALYLLTFFYLLSVRGALGVPSDQQFTLLLSHRTVSFGLLAGTLGTSITLFGYLAKERSAGIREVLHYAWIGLVLLFLSLETHDWFRQAMQGATGFAETRLGFREIMVLAAVWMMYGLILLFAGLRSATRAITYGGLWILLIATLIGGVRGISFIPIESFVSLVNDRSMVLLLLLSGTAAAMWWVGRNQHQFDWLPEMRETMQVVIVVLVLILLSGEIRDYYEKAIVDAQVVYGKFGAGQELERLENLKQLLLSGSWLFVSIGLMVLGLWKRLRTLRIESIALFGVAILKIFIYDLSFLQSLYRIFSFIGLGVILLAVSYLYQRYKAIVFPAAERSEEKPIA